MSGMKDLFGDMPYDLYDGGPPHQRHSSTSAAAAGSIRQRIGPLHQKIIDYLTRNPAGACDERLGRMLNIGMNTLRPRRRELQLMGRVQVSGRTELTATGRAAVIWILARNP